MTVLTYEDVVAAVGPVDDHLIAEVLATGASAEELTDAQAWLANDEAPLNTGRPLPTGRLARLVELIEAAEDCLPAVSEE
jgi:hypothetical protein